MNYRREVDGLRAVAILPVMLFHAGFRAFSGGFVGVDVFFVISGYLITSLILTELEDGTFSILKFYERRARRILPALFTVLIVSVPFAWLLLAPDELTSFSGSIAAVALFLSNFFFLQDGGYFATAADLKPMLHTWSIAVEEQYYLLFPIFLVSLWRFGRRAIGRVIISGVLASFIIAQVCSVYWPKPNFLLLPTRAWEIGVGALIAWGSFRSASPPLSLPQRQGWSVAGFALLVLAICLFDRETPFPGIYALLPTVGTALLIVFATPDTYIGTLLSSRPLVGIGLASYSAYLWHQPVFAFVRHVIPFPGVTLSLLLVTAVIVLSFASLRVVEAPFRKKKAISGKAILYLSTSFSVLLVAFGFATSRVDYADEVGFARELASGQAIFASNMNEREFIKARIELETLQPTVLVLGSSRIMQLGRHIYPDSILNLAVSGSSVEDDIAIGSLALRRFHPSGILIGADPWLFNRRSGQDRWKVFSEEFRSAVSALDSPGGAIPGPATPTPIVGARAAGFGAQLYRSISMFNVRAEDDSPTTMDKIRRDGSRVYSVSYANTPRVEVERRATSYVSYAMASYEDSEEARQLFERFVASLSQHHRVALVLSPYHPKLFALMTARHAEFLAIEKQFRAIASRHGVRVLGSYDPSLVGCGDDEFFDGMHPKDSCMIKVLSPTRT